ncbi:MAG: hypothetical protein AAGD25_39370 [Cyanobacteria bacterium P01_F01_bin.150]
MTKPSDLVRRFFLWTFLGLTFLVLGLDSVAAVDYGLHGQAWANGLGIAYFSLLLFALTPQQRLMALVFVPFSAIGEGIFSLLFGLYRYRLGMVPIYVPFGHAILFSMGLLVSELPAIRDRKESLRPIFIALYVAAFGTAILWLHDTLSAIFGLVFLWVLRRKGYNSLYFLMGLFVLYVELVGTHWGCWAWTPHPFNQSWLSATNPPVGAFACYVLADLGVMKIVRHLGARLDLNEVDTVDTLSNLDPQRTMLG